MNRRLLVGTLPLWILAACDTDGDGLSNAEEKKLGTAIDMVDTDGDGLSDAEEVNEHGTDPTLADSDDDGYLDKDEITEGSDPTDASDGIYAGGWPYNASKDDLTDPGLDAQLEVGEQLGRFVYVDQYGEEVDIYDFAHQGAHVIIDISAENCPPCRGMADWLAGDDDAGYNQTGIPTTWGPVVRQALEDHEVYWVTVLYATYGYWDPVSDAGAATTWADHYQNHDVPVLAGLDNTVSDHLYINFAPNLWLLDENLTLLRGPSSQSWAPPLEELLDILSQ